MAENPGKTIKDSFDSTFLRTQQEFFSTFADSVKDAIENDKYDTYVICLDKNHPPFALTRTIDTIAKVEANYTENRNYKIIKIAMIPEMIQPF